MPTAPGTYNPLGIHPGETVELVRWALMDGNWHPITVSGKFLRLADDGWQIVNGQHVRSYPRELWEVCIA